MSKPKILMIVGPSCSGKDSVARGLTGVNKMILGTTRPPREGEKDSKDYSFFTLEQYLGFANDKHILSSQCFNSWYYFVSDLGLMENEINLIVANPAMAIDIIDDGRFKTTTIEIVVPNKIRLTRAIERDSNNLVEVCRRFIADEQDFEDFHFLLDNRNYHPIMLNNNILEDAIKTAQQIIDLWADQDKE